MAELIRCQNVHTGAFATLAKDALRFFPDYVVYDGPDPDQAEETTDAEDSANKEEE